MRNSGVVGSGVRNGTGGPAILQTVLWAAAVAVTLSLAYLRWRSASRAPIGADFGYSLAAAREVAAGRSPYLVKQYVYPPPIAILLAPFVHFHVVTVWKAWMAVTVGAPVIGIAAFVSMIEGRRVWWLRPGVFAACGFTIFYGRYYPMSRDLSLGQSDTIVFTVLTLSAVAASRAASRTRGGMVGLAGLVKVWPWSAVLSVLQPAVPRRRQTLLYAVAVALIAPLTAVIFGWTGLAGFLRNDFDARQQKLVSDSVWSMPRLLFTHSGLAQPIAVSTTLRLLLTAVLAIWVLALLGLAVSSASDGALGTWNVIFCVMLLLPVSHRQYAMFALPLLWWWTTSAVTQSTKNWWTATIVGVLVLWWLNQTVTWPYNGASNGITALRYGVSFAGDLVACTASVLGARLIDTTHGLLHTPAKDQVSGSIPLSGSRLSLSVGFARLLHRHTADR